MSSSKTAQEVPNLGGFCCAFVIERDRVIGASSRDDSSVFGDGSATDVFSGEEIGGFWGVFGYRIRAL